MLDGYLRLAPSTFPKPTAWVLPRLFDLEREALEKEAAMKKKAWQDRKCQEHGGVFPLREAIPAIPCYEIREIREIREIHHPAIGVYPIYEYLWNPHVRNLDMKDDVPDLALVVDEASMFNNIE